MRTGTDKNWGSSCPQICTYQKSAAGNEAILRCQSGVYCCDKNRVSGNCCTDKGFISFSLADGNVVAAITAVDPNAPPSKPSQSPQPPQPSTSQQSSNFKVPPAAPSSSPPTSIQMSAPGTSGRTSPTPSTSVQTAVVI